LGNDIVRVNTAEETKKCVWSYITDKGSPELGEAGKIDMGEDWEKMSKNGWRLIAVNSVHDYIFEKCEYAIYFEKLK
jgi:hypothetical protein